MLDRRWISPVLTAIVVLSSFFAAYDFEAAQRRFPEWAGGLGILGSSLMWILVGSALFELALSIGRASRERTMSALAASLDEANSQIDEIGSAIRQFFDGMLFSFSKRLNLTQDDQVRISIYIHDTENKRFIPCGRYSPNPNFTKPGRTHYRDDEGCIGKGWDHGWHFDNDFPADKPARRKYEKESYGVQRAIADNIKMQSRLYAVKRISHGEEALAVVVVEALDSVRFEQIFLQAAMDEHNDNFASMVRSLRNYIPNPSHAEESGL
ncbi:hypothetical protein G6K99_02285 [Neorhizobium sp. AL 9.2.2]|nr:hypothetical protein [Neorhizobium sp. AL 9.2.2]